MAMASILRDSGFNPIVIDQRVQPNWRELLHENINDSLWLGFSLMVGPSIIHALDVAKVAKKWRNDIPIVCGGNWPTVAAKITLSNYLVDYIVVGSGDHAVVSLTKYFLGENKNLPDCVYSKEDINNINESTIKFEQVTPIKSSYWRTSYDVIPDINLYKSSNNVAALFAASSCPYGKCKFCSIMQPYEYYIREPNDILDEVSFLVNDKCFSVIFFLDGLFFVNRQHTLELVKGFKDRQFKMEWKGRVRSNSFEKFTPKDINLFKETGLKVVAAGFESGSDKVLKSIIKGVKAKDAFKLARICNDYELELQASYLFGLPGETVEDLKLTIEHIERIKDISKKFYYSNYFYAPIPGTESYDEFVKLGGEVPSTLDQWGKALWEEVGISNVPWLSNKEKDKYVTIYNNYFKPTIKEEQNESAKGIFEFRHKSHEVS